VADFHNRQIKKFATNGAFVTKWNTHGSGDSQYTGHEGIVADTTGRVYVTDWYNGRVLVYAKQGTTPTPTVSPVVSIPGGTGVPRDLGGDGKYEDVNGNNRKDFADVTLYFSQITWIAWHEPLAAFD
jgi:PKD repeat protein